ncbi:MAG: methyl-accepting chemotaxis protein [Candidatus Omnitrophota bacterium]
MADKSKNNRGNYFIKRAFQVRYAVTIFLAMFVIAIIAVWTTVVTTWTIVAESTNSPGIVIQMSDIFDSVSMTLIGSMLVGISIVFLFSIFVSHKIAGPIFRLEKIARQISLGDLTLTNIKVREGDELGELATAIDGVVRRLRRLIDKYKDMTAKVSALIKELALSSQAGKNMTAESQRLLKEVETVNDQLLKELSYFRTKEINKAQEDDITDGY